MVSTDRGDLGAELFSFFSPAGQGYHFQVSADAVGNAQLEVWLYHSLMFLLPEHESVMRSYGNTARRQGRYVPGRQV